MRSSTARWLPGSDFDSIWGTLLNKYVVQAVVLNKLLIYGRGKQKRGYLSLYDSVNCLSLLLSNPPAEGEVPGW